MYKKLFSANLITRHVTKSNTVFKYPLAKIYSFCRGFHSSLPKLSSPTGATESVSSEGPKGKAMKLLDWFPGDTLAKKTGYVTIGGGLASYLIVNDIYIVNEETLVLASFIAFMRVAFKYLSPPIANLLDKSIDEIRYKWNSSQEKGKKDLKEHIVELESFRDYEDVTREFLETKRENIHLEAQLHELLQVNKEYSQVKSVLDERLRFELEKRDQEKKLLVASIIEGVMAELKDPKMQDSILSQCLLDIEQLSVQTK